MFDRFYKILPSNAPNDKKMVQSLHLYVLKGYRNFYSDCLTRSEDTTFLVMICKTADFC